MASVSRVGRNRREAERALRKVAVSVDEGAFRPQRNMTFADWGKDWLSSLERKPSTRHSYASSVKYAAEAFGRRRARDVRPDDIARMSIGLREAGLTASTRAKHLRVLHACFEAAVEHDFAGRNPVAALSKTQRPRAGKKEAAFFENHELPPY